MTAMSVGIDRIVPGNRDDPFAIGHDYVLTLSHHTKPDSFECTNGAQVRNASDPHGLQLENNLSFLSSLRQSPGHLQVFADGIVDVFQSFLFSLTLRGAPRQPGHPNAKALFRLF
jgi:hypothetical protein